MLLLMTCQTLHKHRMSGLVCKAFNALGSTIVFISVAENFPCYLNKLEVVSCKK